MSRFYDRKHHGGRTQATSPKSHSDIDSLLQELKITK